MQRRAIRAVLELARRPRRPRKSLCDDLLVVVAVRV